MANQEALLGDKLVTLMSRIRELGLADVSSGMAQLSPAQMALLDWIYSSDGCGVQDIAQGLGLTSPTVSVGVRRLEAAGLIKRQPGTNDRRSVHFSLTPKGQAIQQESLQFRRQKLDCILKGLSIPEQETLLQLLEKGLCFAESNGPEEQKRKS